MRQTHPDATEETRKWVDEKIREVAKLITEWVEKRS